MSSLKEEVEELVNEDPVRAVRLCHTVLLIQSVSAILTAGATAEDLRECVEEAIRQALGTMATVDDPLPKNRIIIGH